MLLEKLLKALKYYYAGKKFELTIYMESGHWVVNLKTPDRYEFCSKHAFLIECVEAIVRRWYATIQPQNTPITELLKT